jgi:thiol-disulfide isomerase/thioredoxin
MIMRVLSLLALMLGFTCAALADPPATPAPPAPAATASADPAANEAWAKIGADATSLTDAERAHDLAGLRAAVPKVRADATDFIQKFPSDERTPGAKLMQAQSGQIALGLDLPGAPTRAVVLAQFHALATDPSVPMEIRVHASMVDAQQIFMSVMDEAKDNPHNPAMWNDLESRIEAFEKTAGDAPGQEPQGAVLMLRHSQISLLEQAGETARLQALLAQLEKSPQPKIVEMAQDAAAKSKADFDLKSKPLDLKFASLDGRAVDLAQLRGKVVLLDFWATWCPPCRAETPGVVAAYQKYHDKGFAIVGISLDQDKGALQKYVADNKMPWPQYFDGKGWDNKVSSSFGIDSIPAMWLVGKDGKVITTDARDDLGGNVEKALAAQ